MTRLEKFMQKEPTLLLTIEHYNMYEHPTRGDTDQIYMATTDGYLIGTGFYDLGDFDADLCEELYTDYIAAGGVK